MRPPRFARLALTLLLLSVACENGKKSTLQLPPDLGKGLSPADSLLAVLNYLEERPAYEAETLRFHHMHQLVTLLAETRNNPDTLPYLLRKLEGWATKSTYPIAKGIADLAWVQFFSGFSRSMTQRQSERKGQCIYLRRRGDWIIWPGDTIL